MIRRARATRSRKTICIVYRSGLAGITFTATRTASGFMSLPSSNTNSKNSSEDCTWSEHPRAHRASGGIIDDQAQTRECGRRDEQQSSMEMMFSSLHEHCRKQPHLVRLLRGRWAHETRKVFFSPFLRIILCTSHQERLSIQAERAWRGR